MEGRPGRGRGQTLKHYEAQQLTWLKITIATALICGFLLSWNLWVSTRLFPLAPVSDAFAAVPAPFDRVWLVALLGLLAATVVTARPRRLIVCFLALAAALSLWDQTRWQPWFYQYLFMLAALAFGPWHQPAGRRLPALDTCRAIVVFTYLWSGLQKLNANFVSQTWPDMAASAIRFLPSALTRLPPAVALTIPLLEICIGLGLMTRRYRRFAVVSAIATHIVALTLLVSSRENTVVWPWNVAMIVFVLILFWRDADTTPSDILAAKNAVHVAAVLVLGILPAFSLLDLWDSYLSSALYSGNTDQAVIYVPRAVIERLPASIRPHIWQATPPFFLDINRWAYGELNVPVYPEPRVYKRVTQRICAYAEGSSEIKLRINGKPNPFTGRRPSEFYDCAHLDE